MKLMKKIIFATGLLLSSLVFATDDAPEGSIPVNQAQPEYFAKNGKVIVQQFLWHECVHCFRLEPIVDEWENKLPDYIEFERIPVAWADRHVRDGSFLNYAKVMKKNKQITHSQFIEINNALFDIGVVKRKGLSVKTAFPIFKKFGIQDEEHLQGLLGSILTRVEIEKSKKLTKEYGIEGVPLFVIGGKYLVGYHTIKEATPDELFATIERIAKAEAEASSKINKEVKAEDKREAAK